MILSWVGNVATYALIGFVLLTCVFGVIIYYRTLRGDGTESKPTNSPASSYEAGASGDSVANDIRSLAERVARLERSNPTRYRRLEIAIFAATAIAAAITAAVSLMARLNGKN